MRNAPSVSVNAQYAAVTMTQLRMLMVAALTKTRPLSVRARPAG
jgi:hypothetical protein